MSAAPGTLGFMTCPPTFCPILPPYLLERVAGTGPASLADGVHATLDHDRGLRPSRDGRRPAMPAPARAATTAAGPQRSIFDARNTTRLPGTLVRAEGAAATGDTSADEAYEGLGDTWRLLHEVLGRDSLDDRGLGLLATVHYGRDYLNAFWDGERMVFGDGDGELFVSFTASLDVIAHELAHGLTQYTSGLAYSGQSGALNEHVSDVFGVVTKQFSLGQSATDADWLIGAELLAPGVSGVALRSMAAPGTAYDDPRLGADPQPATMSDYVVTTDDYGGVHINSGIPNKAFHVLATTLGGPAWQAPLRIWYDTITGDIDPDCDFATFAGLTLAAAATRYGAGSAEVDAVAAAWAAVEATPGAAPATEAPRPEADTRLDVRRSGGFAGLTRSASVRLGDLPGDDADAWRDLLAGRRLSALAEDVPDVVPDGYCYDVRCQRPEVDVTLPERALPDAVRELLDRTLDA